MVRLTVGSDAQITSDPFLAADGETPATLTAPPTVTVTRATGETLPALATPTAQPDGSYRAVLTGADHLSKIDRLTVTWTAGSTVQRQTVDVVAGRYATLADVRRVAALSSSSEFSARRISQAIAEFEDIADAYRGVAFTPRVAVDTVRLRPGWATLRFSWAEVTEVRAVLTPAGALTGYALSGELLGIDTHAGFLTSATADVAATVVYVHGLTNGVPETLRRACVEYVRSTLLREASGMPRDVISTAADGFVTRYSTPDWMAGRPTGYLEVDRLLNQLPDRRLPGVL